VAALASASPVEQYGFGARAMGRAQGGVALTDGPAATMLNPAGLTRLKRQQVLVGYAVMRYDLHDLPEVSWDTNQDGVLDASDGTLDLGPDYEVPDGVMAAHGWPLGSRLGLGLAFFTPKDRLLRYHNVEPSLPTYLMYENRPLRYAMAAGLAAEPVDGVSLGLAVRMIPQMRLTTAFTVDAVFAGGADEVEGAEDLLEAGVDTHDVTLDLSPGLVPMVGLQVHLGAWAAALDGLWLAGTWRGEGGMSIDASLDAQINVGAEDIGEFEPLLFATVAHAALQIYDHYLPRQVQAGASYTLSDTFSVYVDVQRTWWNRMEVNVARVLEAELVAPLVDLSEVEVVDGNPLDLHFRDTTGLRTGTELRLPEWQLPTKASWMRAVVRGGFGYEPAALEAQGEDTAFLDADRLIFAGGLGFEHGSFWPAVLQGPMAADSFFQLHRLADGELPRPETSGLREGYPPDGATIPIGGTIWSAGVQWSVEY